MPTGIKFIPSLVNGISTVGVGLSTIVGPTGPAGAFGGPQGNIGPQGPSNGGSGLPTGANYGDYLYWNGTGSFLVGDNNINLGSKSGEQSVGLYNVAIGYNAGFTGGFSSQQPFASTATGTSIAIGYYAGYEQACNSIAIGNLAGYFQDFNNIAIGSSAGYLQNEINNIAIGIAAGSYNQGTGGRQYGQGGNSIAIGSTVGNNLQGYESVAIGYYAAENRQGHNSVAIGTNAGEFSQGNFSVAIGANAGVNNQANESIIINASSSSTLDASTSGLFINPIRNAGSSQTLFYDPSTKEITYYSTGSNGPQGFQGLAGTTGTNGVQGAIGEGFKVFATTPSYTGLNTIIATGGNIGEFVLITGGDLFVYSGTGAGSTGPDNSYEYAGDVTDESKLVGLQGAVGFQGNQGFQGFQGFQGGQYTGPFIDITFSGNMSGANAYLQNLAAENFASQGAIIGFDGLTVVGPTNLISPLNATGGLTTTSATITDLIVSGNITLPAGYLDSQVAGKSSQFIFNNNGQATGSFNALFFTGTSTGSNVYAGSSIIPTEDALYNLGSPDHLWKSIYISTGTIFIGPTGTLGLDNNGIISSAAGFATPFIEIGSTTPGNGITLYTQGDKLFFQNQFGASGAVSIWNVASNNINNTFFTGGNIGIGINNPDYPLTVKGTIYCEGLTGTNLPIGPQGSQGSIGIGSQGNQGSIGPIGGTNTQILFNQTGIATGSSNLTYNYTNNMVTLPNVTASSGSFSNLLVSSANIRLGGGAGSINQRTSSIAIGNSSGQTNQGTGTSSQGYSVAIGHLSGNNNQGYGSVGIGYSSGQINQGELSVSIGTSSGNISQGTRSIGIGQGSGYQYQGNYSISMGDSSGQDYQGTESVAIGRSAGLTHQNPYSVAIGPYAGSSYQSTGNVNAGSVAIGSHSGQTLQQYQAVALGYYAGSNNQGANSIAIGANAGYTNQSNNSIIINASGNQINSTGSGLFINPLREYTQQGIMTYNTSSSEIAYSTTTASIPNLTVTTMTGGTIYTNKINIDQGGIYFSTGSKTGCFIDGVNYNTTGADHYVYYNSRTHELTQSSPVYFFSYATGTQLFTGTNNFQAVRFDTNNILYHTFQHVGKSSVFTGTFQSQVVLNFEYSLQMHTTANGVFTSAAALYLDDVAIPGSYRSVSLKDNQAEYILSNDIIVTIPSGGHKIELKAATTNTSIQIGGVPNIPAPDQSYTSVNLRCSRII